MGDMVQGGLYIKENLIEDMTSATNSAIPPLEVPGDERGFWGTARIDIALRFPIEAAVLCLATPPDPTSPKNELYHSLSPIIDKNMRFKRREYFFDGQSL